MVCPAHDPLLDSPLFDMLSASSPDVYLYVSDMKADCSRWSDSLLREFALPEDYWHDTVQVWTQFIHPDDRALFLSSMDDLLSGRSGDRHCCEYRAKNRNGVYVWLRCMGRLRRDADGRPALFAGVMTNLGPTPQYDAVTGLPTLYRFFDDLAPALIPSLRQPCPAGGLLLFGINGFSRINDFHDYSFGNRVLRALAERFLALPLSGTFYRMDGDKFAYWQTAADAPDLEVAFTMCLNCASNLFMEGTAVPLTLSGGYVLYPENGLTLDELHSRLETAFSCAKRSHHGSLCSYTDDMYQAEHRRQQLYEALHRDVENGCANFEVYYQPLLLTDGEVAAEALLRWRSPDFPSIGPSDFVPVLEATGDILPVGDWVVRQALSQLKRWKKEFPFFKKINANVSYRQVIQPDFAANVCAMYREAGLPPFSLCLELTESCRVADPELLQRALIAFRENGICTGLDDFGTGYANFTVLRRLTPDLIKLDYDLTRDVLVSHTDLAVVRSIVELAHELGIRVCLEGIENAQLADAALSLGADQLQGFFFLRPVPPAQLEAWLRERTGGPLLPCTFQQEGAILHG